MMSIVDADNMKVLAFQQVMLNRLWEIIDEVEEGSNEHEKALTAVAIISEIALKVETKAAKMSVKANLSERPNHSKEELAEAFHKTFGLLLLTSFRHCFDESIIHGEVKQDIELANKYMNGEIDEKEYANAQLKNQIKSIFDCSDEEALQIMDLTDGIEFSDDGSVAALKLKKDCKCNKNKCKKKCSNGCKCNKD